MDKKIANKEYSMINTKTLAMLQARKAALEQWRRQKQNVLDEEDKIKQANQRLAKQAQVKEFKERQVRISILVELYKIINLFHVDFNLKI